MNVRAMVSAIWLPGGLLILAWVLAAGEGFGLQIPTIYLTPGLALAGALLGLRFHQMRAAFALVVLTLAHFALVPFFAKPPGAGAMGQVLYAGAAILLPVNLVVIAFLGERGLFTRSGLLRLSAIIAQGAVLFWLVTEAGNGPAGAAAWAFHWRALGPELDQWTYLPQPSLFVLVLGGLILLVRFVTRPTPLTGGLLGAFVAGGAAFHMVGRGPVPEIFMMAAILGIGLAVLQEFYRMAFLDELPGLPGRRALGAEMKKLGGRYCLAMLDVDHFKNFNDSYGYEVGDQVLKLVAARLAGVRGGGKSFRYGGEEFTTIFPAKDMEEAWPHLEDLRQAVEETSFQL
ncbi:MAG: GGDEF domain-containing protein, partial [Rhodospirillales bacterium]|nr:GGDEF domain-containing protein [Rhodospirillales bacterium]